MLERQSWIDPETLLRLLRKLSAVLDFIGSPAELDRFETTEYTTALASFYFENKLRLMQAVRDAKYVDFLRPAVRHREHWPRSRVKAVRHFAALLFFGIILGYEE